MSGGTEIREEADVVVVGGGPCGSTAAALLAEAGRDVLIVDKDEFPREKPCGDGIMHPAVLTAERLGLGDLIESSLEIEATRLVVAHRRQTLSPIIRAPDRPRPRCITRKDFDAGLLGAARVRGARFLRARVDGFEEANGERRLLAAGAGGEFAVRAGMVIAADGATSRLRRALSPRPLPPIAYAVRRYFRSEKPLDPIFDCYAPLEIDGRVLSGYGWVFPLDEHTANVGIGFYREEGRSPQLTRVLASFVEELQSKAAHRFGELEALGEPYGSPVGIRPRIEGSVTPSVVFAGDAAGTTHALTGEGIAFAMRAGEVVARAIDARSNGNSPRPSEPLDAALSRPFPQLGVDISMVYRSWSLEMNKGGESQSLGSAAKPFLSVVKRMMGESAYETKAEGTPVWRALDAHDAALGRQLERANDALLDSLANRMPFVTEVIHRCTRSHLGPMYAAVALGTAVAEGEAPPDSVHEAAITAESVGMLPELLTMLVDRARSKPLRANNALAILTGDFAATRALAAAAKLGAPAVSALSHACQLGCEGGMRDAAARFSADRSIESWFLAAGETAGAATVLATQLGAIVRGEGPEDADSLREYGTELGIAIRLAEEIVNLTGDGRHPGREGEGLRRGIYPLPVLYAIEAEPGLPRLLTQHIAESGEAAEINAVVRESGGLDRAVAACVERAAAARVLAAAAPAGAAEVLALLAEVPVEYLASCPPVESAGHSAVHSTEA